MRLNHCTTMRNLTAPVSGLRFANAGAALALAALLALALSGCGSMKPVKYYQLTHPPTTPLAPSQTPVDVSLLVRPFQTAHLYREDRIVYGGEGEQLGLYETHRWIEPPVELLQDALARALRTSGQFRAVTTLRSDASADIVLTGHLYAFREISAGSVVARLNFDVELKDQKAGKVLWRHTYNHDEPSSGKTVADVAAAMDKNVQISVQQIQDGILQALANYSRK
ncbi:MAG TPA: ABC-type transport auxiliary lipoprotein family protein [Candidatus Acidoferrales bacterium]|nr:ABC-type transport auxiliary lipoprotein family protein [Candidatus Acidoferrales bacterium]